MFDGFNTHDVSVPGGLTIQARVGGNGPGLLLLHGFPQTHVCWHKVAPVLAQSYSVVVTDLRGYGASSKPGGLPDHATYCKRAMADDQIAVMRQLGFERFHVVGHDRGGRVAHRLALDHAEAVERLALLDVAPTATMYDATDRAFAEAYYHWFFLIQPGGLPERLIGADPRFYLEHTLKSWCKVDGAITTDAMAAYNDAFCCLDAIHAACEDYRASATIDLMHDAADTEAGRLIEAPLLVVWGDRGVVGRQFAVISSWQEKANSKVEGIALDCGHFVPEEDPEGLLAVLGPFLAGTSCGGSG